METLLLDAKKEGAVETAAEIIKKGGLVAIPTETVYGLAANAFDPVACANIFKAKGRPGDNPLIVHICSMDMISDVVEEVSGDATVDGAAPCRLGTERRQHREIESRRKCGD